MRAFEMREGQGACIGSFGESLSVGRFLVAIRNSRLVDGSTKNALAGSDGFGEVSADIAHVVGVAEHLIAEMAAAHADSHYSSAIIHERRTAAIARAFIDTVETVNQRIPGLVDHDAPEAAAMIRDPYREPDGQRRVAA